MAAYIRGNYAEPGTNVSTISCAYSSNDAADLLVVAVETAANTKTTITDTAGNVWQTASQQTPTSPGWGVRVFYAENCKASAGSNTVTITCAAVQHMRLIVAEYSGVATSLSFSSTPQAVGTSTSMSTGSFATTTGDLVVAVGFGLAGGTTVGSSLTARDANGFFVLADATATGSTFTATMTQATSNTWTLLAVVFHPNPAPSQGQYRGGDTSQSNSTTGTYTESAVFTSNTAGNLLVAFVEVSVGTLAASVTDAAGNTWTFLTSISSPSGWTLGAYYVSGCAPSLGANKVTASFTATQVVHIRFWIAEYSTGIPIGNSNSAAGSAPLSVSVPSSPGNLIVTFGLGIGPNQAGAGYAMRKTDFFTFIADALASANPETPQITGSGNATIIAISIGPAGGGNQPVMFWIA